MKFSMLCIIFILTYKNYTSQKSENLKLKNYIGHIKTKLTLSKINNLKLVVKRKAKYLEFRIYLLKIIEENLI